MASCWCLDLRASRCGGRAARSKSRATGRGNGRLHSARVDAHGPAQPPRRHGPYSATACRPEGPGRVCVGGRCGLDAAEAARCGRRPRYGTKWLDERVVRQAPRSRGRPADGDHRSVPEIHFLDARQERQGFVNQVLGGHHVQIIALESGPRALEGPRRRAQTPIMRRRYVLRHVLVTVAIPRSLAAQPGRGRGVTLRRAGRRGRHRGVEGVLQLPDGGWRGGRST